MIFRRAFEKEQGDLPRMLHRIHQNREFLVALCFTFSRGVPALWYTLTDTELSIFIFSSVRSDIFLFLFLGSNTYSSVVLCATDEICSVILNNNISDVVTRQRTPQLLLIASCSTLLRSILHEEVLLFLLFVLARCGKPYYTIKKLYASTFFDSQVCCLSYLYSL